MPIGTRLKAAALNLFHKSRVEADLDKEVRAYVESLADELIASGVPAAEARRRALAETGGIEPVKQAVRDGRAGTAFEVFLRDARYGVRQLKRNPAFAWTAILTLALGIGATTTIFSAVYSLLLRPLPYPNAGQLMAISSHSVKAPGTMLMSPDFVASQEGLKSFQQFAGYVWRNRNVTGAGDPVRVNWVGVTANFLPMLGVVPQLGRNIRPEEDRPGGPPVVLLSDHFWRNQLHGDPKVVGKTVTLDGTAETVIGVLPANFSFPDLVLEPDLYAPLDMNHDATFSVSKPIFGVHAIARLRDGVSPDQAAAEVQSFFQERARNYPAFMAAFLANVIYGRQMVVEPLQRDLIGDNRKSLLILFVSVLAVLLIACVNVANLQLARATSRRHETAVRNALGASRLRIIRQLLVENSVLSILAAALGCVFAFAATFGIRHANSLDASGTLGSWRMAEVLRLPFGKLSGLIHVDGWVIAFAAAVAVFTTLLFGLAPAVVSTRADLRGSLQTAALRISAGPQQRFLRHTLLVFEVALAVALLYGSGLLIRSFVQAMRYDSGFDPAGTLTATTLLDDSRYSSPAQGEQFSSRLLARLQVLPGVGSAALASSLPLGLTDSDSFSFGNDPNPPMAARQFAPSISVTPDYFRSIGTPLIAGRPFDATDNASSPLVAIVNRAFARRFFNGDAVGKHLRVDGVLNNHPAMIPATVVGVAEDVRHSGLERDVEPEIYLPMAQFPNWIIHLVLRANGDLVSLVDPMRKALLAVDPQQPLFDVETMDERVGDALSQRRMIMLLIAVFAALALILSAVGVYGVFAYSVSQREREMGIRLALGASRARLLRLVVGQAARLILIGSALGIGTALWIGRFLSSALVGVTPHDAVSLFAACSVMAAVAVMASFLPALTAANTDPNAVLRAE
jgi:putative ABC transport system permease protein